jgi:phosphoglycolate phosphatase-like HAD superfamily hydrolase
MASLVFLDFDGVICDSALECLVSSWNAYVGRHLPAAVPADLRKRFLALRPYVRSGEDFVLCQEILDRDLPIGSQEDFDRFADGKGSAALAELREKFYAARADLLERDPAYWLGLNRLYPWVGAHLPRWSSSPCAFILSTKRREFIQEILQAAKVRFPLERILTSGKQAKGAQIEQLIRKRNARSALIIDDQIDHLAAIQAASNRTEVFLAAWGYVKPEWLRETTVPILQMHEIGALVDGALRRCGE